MNCPKCNEVKLTVVEEHKVELDYCEECGGIWFDHGELMKLADKGKELSFDTIYSKSTPMAVDHQIAVCPVCDVVLEKAPNKDITNIIIDKCPNCEGIWLDGGEFNRISKEKLINQLRKYI